MGFNDATMTCAMVFSTYYGGIGKRRKIMSQAGWKTSRRSNCKRGRFIPLCAANGNLHMCIDTVLLPNMQQTFAMLLKKAAFQKHER